MLSSLISAGRRVDVSRSDDGVVVSVRTDLKTTRPAIRDTHEAFASGAGPTMPAWHAKLFRGGVFRVVSRVDGKTSIARGRVRARLLGNGQPACDPRAASGGGFDGNAPAMQLDQALDQ